MIRGKAVNSMHELYLHVSVAIFQCYFSWQPKYRRSQPIFIRVLRDFRE